VFNNAFFVNKNSANIRSLNGRQVQLTMGFKKSRFVSSISALAQICKSAELAWGQKSFSLIILGDQQTWLQI